jgi:hypothetical protein
MRLIFRVICRNSFTPNKRICLIVCLLFVFQSLLARADEQKAIRDEVNGALVWRPYPGRVRWVGERDSDGFASGSGRLSIFDRQGNLVAVFSGTMNRGHLSGQVTAEYPRAPERASYEGGFSDWSENGHGTMTYRDGRREIGYWLNGDLQNETSPTRASPMVAQESKSHSLLSEYGGSQGVVANLPEIESRLQLSYDQLKGKLQGPARDDLVTWQRSWIRYDEHMEKIAFLLWQSRGDLGTLVQQLQATVTIQRTEEVNFIHGWITGEPLSIDEYPDQDALESEVKEKLQALAGNGNIGVTQVKALSDSWAEASRIVGLVAVGQASQEAKRSIADAFYGLSLFNLSESLSLLIEEKPKSGTIMPASMPAAVAMNPEEKALLVKRGGILKDAIVKHWTIDQAARAAIGDPLPEELSEDLRNLIEELGAVPSLSVESEISVETENASPFRFLISAQEVDTAFRLWRTNADEANAKIQMPLSSSHGLDLWWSGIQKYALTRKEKAEGLRVSAMEKLKESDIDAAVSRLNDAAIAFPLPAQDSVTQIVKAYAKFSQDKSIRASDGDWTKPTLPDLMILDEAVKAAEEYDRLPDSQLKALLAHHRVALGAANLMRSFVNDIQPSGELDSPHPVWAFQRMRDKENWIQLSRNSSAESKPISDRLQSLEKLIAPKLSEFEGLIELANKAEAESRFILSAEYLRKAYTIEKQAYLLEKARMCEGKASGL